MVAIVAKDAKTGKTKVLNYNTKPIFGRSYENYENVFLTGMVEAKTVGWKEARRWGSDDYKGKELVIAEKNGRFGVGAPYLFKNKEELPYKHVSVMKIPYGDTKLPVIIGVTPDGEYEALHPNGWGIYYNKPMGYNEEGKLVLMNTSVHGYVLAEVIEEIKEALRTNPKNWNLTAEEIR